MGNVNGDVQSHLASPSAARIAIACLAFTLIMLAVFPAFLWFGRRQAGADGIAAAGVAAALCWASAGISLAILGVSARKGQATIGMLLGMLFRMGPPLVACLVFVGESSALAQAGVRGMILVYYLVGLFAETLLSVRLVSGARGSGKKPASQNAVST